MDCEFISGCIFFEDKMTEVPVTANIFKTAYCKGDKSRCARFIVRECLGKERVPADLFPNQLDRANALIAVARVVKVQPTVALVG